MACPSTILLNLSPQERKGLAGIVAVSLPADDLADGQWSVTLLEDILVFLDLDKSLAEGFYPITERARGRQPPTADQRALWEERVGPFRESLPPVGEPRLVVLRDLMVMVALRCGYDARTRVTFRRVCDAMQIPWHPRVSEVESTLARKVYERVTRERERELRGDRWRGVKIGAAMIGGGALLAVTGGLAAPAFAAGVAASSSIIGTAAATTLSGFATTAWMATVFGATGAGLVGFKMDRRTKGVKEFEFESETSVGEEMCVSICVPGVLRDKADLQRAWGVEPWGPDVSALERLRRFYYVYNREKVVDVEKILQEYDGKELQLCKRIVARYGADPRDPPTRAALARAEGRTLEGVSQEDVMKDAEAIGELMECVLQAEKEEKEKTRIKAKVVANLSSNARQQPAPTRVVKPSAPPATGATPASSMKPSDAGTAAEKPPPLPQREKAAANVKVDVPTVDAAVVAAPLVTPSDSPAVAEPVAISDSSPQTEMPGSVTACASLVHTTANDDAGEASLLRDWDRDADGQVESPRQDTEALASQQSGKPSGNDGTRQARAKTATPSVVGKASDGGDSGVSGKTEEIELFVDDDLGVKEGEEDGDSLKHRVWFWQDKLPHTDQYVLRWETDLLVTLGKSVETLIKSLSQSAMQETLKYTTLAAIMTSLTWPLALISLSNMIDADWTIGRQRADIAGKILADALLSREQGCRPVTLVGTSLGARLIFACLEEIARRHELWEEQTVEAREDPHVISDAISSGRSKMDRYKKAFTPGNNGKSKAGLNGVGVSGSGGGANATGSGSSNEARCAAGVIENVCLLGAAVGSSNARWERVARVVHGRIINGYSKSDVILGLVFRAKSLSLSVAGVQEVTAPGIENVDLSSVVGSNHFNYNRKMPEILPLLALDDCSKYIGRGDSQDLDSSARSSNQTTVASPVEDDNSIEVMVFGS